MDYKELLKEFNHEVELNKNLNNNIKLLRRKIYNLINENELLKEENKSLKDGIHNVYDNMVSLEIIRKQETKDIEVI